MQLIGNISFGLLSLLLPEFRFMKYLSFFFVFFLSAVLFATDKVRFDIFLFGNKVGTVTVTQKKSGDTTHYSLDSRTSAKVLWANYEDITSMKVKYVKDQLHTVDYFEDLNQKRKYFTNLVFDGKQYTVSTKSGTRTIEPERFPSLLSLYFKEPNSISKIYFEAQLFSTPLEQIKPNHYVFKTKEGNKNEYIYRNGKIDELICHTPIATVTMKRVD